MKTCKCGKPVAHNGRCKAHWAEYMRAWYAKNKELAREINRRYYHNGGNAQFTQFGITGDDYRALLKQQHGVCAICKTKERKVHTRYGKVYRLAVDHDQKTGKVRGLLCTLCNTAIGSLHHNPALLARAAKYLKGESYRKEVTTVRE